MHWKGKLLPEQCLLWKYHVSYRKILVQLTKNKESASSDLPITKYLFQTEYFFRLQIKAYMAMLQIKKQTWSKILKKKKMVPWYILKKKLYGSSGMNENDLQILIVDALYRSFPNQWMSHSFPFVFLKMSSVIFTEQLLRQHKITEAQIRNSIIHSIQHQITIYRHIKIFFPRLKQQQFWKTNITQ